MVLSARNVQQNVRGRARAGYLRKFWSFWFSDFQDFQIFRFSDLRARARVRGVPLEKNELLKFKWKALSAKIKALLPLVFGVHKRILCTQVRRIPVDNAYNAPVVNLCPNFSHGPFLPFTHLHTHTHTTHSLPMFTSTFTEIFTSVKISLTLEFLAATAA